MFKVDLDLFNVVFFFYVPRENILFLFLDLYFLF